LLGRNHPRSRQIDVLHYPSQVNVPHQGDEKEQPADTSTERAGRQIDSVDVGDCGSFRFDRNRSFVVAPPWQTGETLLPHKDRKSIDADLVTGGSQFALDVVYGEIFLTHGDGHGPRPVTHRSSLRPVPDVLEKGIPLVGVVPEFMAQDAERAWGVGELSGDFMRVAPLDEEGTESFILSVERLFGCEKKPRFGRMRYPISMIYSHADILLLTTAESQDIV
jgi:hypothetical protein